MGFWNNVGQRVRGLLAYDKERIVLQLAKGATASVMPQSGFDLLQAYGYDVLSDYLKLEQDTMSRYVDYEEMDEYAELSAALDIFADDSTQIESLQNKVLWADSNDQTVTEILTDLFDKRLRIDEEAWSMSRTLCKYGSEYDELLVTNDGLIGLNFLPPPTVRRIEGRRGELFGFLQDFRGRFAFSPDEFKQILAQRSTNGGQVTPTDRTVALEDWEVCHMRLRGKSRRAPLGNSVLDGARWVWKRLMLLEDSAMVFRLQRAPERFAFYVDVGDMPPKEAFAYLNKVRQQHKKTKYFNPCLTGETLVECLDGKSRSMRQMADEGGEYWVYSFDLDKGRVVPGLAKNPRKTGEHVPVYRVVLDNGAVVRATGNHPFMTRTGEYKTCDSLTVGESLMPLYLTRTKAGYWHVRQPATGIRESVHSMVARSLWPDDVRGFDRVIHHKDGNIFNNYPCNLEPCDRVDHAKIHMPEIAVMGRAAFVDRIHNDPEFSSEIASRLQRWRDNNIELAKEMGNTARQINCEKYRLISDPVYAGMRVVIRRMMALDTTVTIDQFVDKLNNNEEFLALRKSLPKVRVKFTASLFNELIRRIGLGGFKDLKAHAAREAFDRNNGYTPDDGEVINHKIIDIQPDGYEDVYNLDVDNYHNFFLTAGVCVHNSTGKLDLKANFLEPSEDFYLPIRKGVQGTRIDVLGAPAWQCLSGETKIPLLDGTSPEIKDLVGRQDFWVYSADEKGNIVAGHGHDARVTHQNAEIWEVGLDNGSVIRCTGNHPFMTRAGEWTQAQNLVSGQALMPLYRSKSDTAKGVSFVRKTEVTSAVYDITVDEYHNFAVAQGVIVHNSIDDLSYFRSKLYAAIKVPKTYLGFESTTAKGVLCLTGDTKIPLLDGRTLTMKEIAEKYQGGTFDVYSCDSDGKIVPGEAFGCRVTRPNAEIWEVELDDGTKIRGTADHPFMMRDGSYRELQELNGGDSLMPLYTKVSNGRSRKESLKGYQMVQHPSTGEFEYTHRMVARSVWGEGWSRRENGHIVVCHHASYDKLNNSPSALARMTTEDHYTLHANNAEKILGSPEVTERRIAGVKHWTSTDRCKMIARENLRRCHEDPNSAWHAWQHSDAHRALKSEQMKEQWAAEGSSLLASHQGDDFSEKMSEVAKARWENPEYRAQRAGANNNKFRADASFAHLTETAVSYRCRNRKDLMKWSGYSWPLIVRLLGEAGVTYGEFAEEYIVGGYKLCAKGVCPSGKDNYVTYGKGDKEQRNHKVVSVRNLGVREDCYDFTVKVHHNFAVGATAQSGIFVHNSQEDVRFGKSVLRVQNEMRNGFRKMANVHLAALNINPASVQYELYMTVPSAIFELSQLEVRNAKADFAGRMSQFVSLHWILQKVFGLSDYEIEYIIKERHSEQMADAEVQAKAMGMQQQTSMDIQQGAQQQAQAAATQAATAPQGSQQAQEARQKMREFGSLSRLWPQRRQELGFKSITERELFAGNRDHEKRMEDNLEKVLKNDQAFAKRIAELGEFIHDIRNAIPRR